MRCVCVCVCMSGLCSLYVRDACSRRDRLCIRLEERRDDEEEEEEGSYFKDDYRCVQSGEERC